MFNIDGFIIGGILGLIGVGILIVRSMLIEYKSKEKSPSDLMKK